MITVSVTRTSGKPVPTLPYASVARAILGPKYELSVAFVDTQTARELHQRFKHTPDPVNVFSFPLDDHSGEIVMHLGTVRKNAARFGHSYQQHVLFLLIHGALHLAGYTHGSKMEQQERKWFTKFNMVS